MCQAFLQIYFLCCFCALGTIFANSNFYASTILVHAPPWGALFWCMHCFGAHCFGACTVLVHAKACCASASANLKFLSLLRQC
jgi:hypothetical protein